MPGIFFIYERKLIMNMTERNIDYDKRRIKTEYAKGS